MIERTAGKVEAAQAEPERKGYKCSTMQIVRDRYVCLFCSCTMQHCTACGMWILPVNWWPTGVHIGMG